MNSHHDEQSTGDLAHVITKLTGIDDDLLKVHPHLR